LWTWQAVSDRDKAWKDGEDGIHEW
jgi:hypothetical protein